MLSILNPFSIGKKFKSVIISVIIMAAGLPMILAMASCSKSGDDGAKAKTDPGLCSEGYKANACAYGHADGNQITTFATQPKIAAVHYGKNLDLSKLTPTYLASTDSIHEFTQYNGLNVYKTEGGCGCEMFAEFAPAPESLMTYWSQVNKDTGNYLLGLFLPEKKVKTITQDSIKKASLLVRTDTDKWTLVHEYMHFLFDQQRLKEGVSTESVLGQLDAAAQTLQLKIKDELDSEGSFKSNADKKSYALAYVDYLKSTLRYLKSFALEEVTIEGHLSEKYENGQFSQVTKYARYGAAGYLSSKYESYKNKVSFLKTGMYKDPDSGKSEHIYVGSDELLTELSSSNDPEMLMIKNELSKALDDLNQTTREADSMYDKWVRPLLKSTGVIMALQKTKGCTHEALAQYEDKSLRNYFKQ